MRLLSNFTKLFLLPLIVSSCGGKFYTEADFRKVLKVDTHVHIVTDKGFFEDQAAEDNFALITINVDHAKQELLDLQLENAIKTARAHPGRVFYEPSFLFDTTAWGTAQWNDKVIAYLEKSITKGVVGVKLWKNIGMTVRDRNGKFIMVDDPGLKPVIDFIVGKNLPVTGHLGEPKNCWLPLEEMTIKGDMSYFKNNPQYHMFLHPEYPSYEDQINARDHLLELHPEMKFIGCHLGSLEYNVDELAKRLDKYPNLAVDMAARISHLQYQSVTDREKVRSFCIKYQDRLLYGTDLEDMRAEGREELGKVLHDIWFSDWKFFTGDEEKTSGQFEGKYRGLKLPREVVDKIYSKNAIDWYKLKINL
ncbi:MAG TPA: amidohydrolase family protein [Bacteroidales bacterium]|nr:amidohydrolase family protein [Bacteroidales bacterium]